MLNLIKFEGLGLGLRMSDKFSREKGTKAKDN